MNGYALLHERLSRLQYACSSYVVEHFRGWRYVSVLACCVVLGGMVAQTAGATCSVGWHQQSSPEDPPFCIITPPTSSGWSNYNDYTVYVDAIVDPVRGLGAQGWVPSSKGSYFP